MSASVRGSSPCRAPHGVGWRGCLGRGACDAAPQIPRAPEAGDHGVGVGGGPAMGQRPDFQEEVQNGGLEFQEACLKVLPDEDRPLPLRAAHQWTKNRPTAQCWWRRCQTQTRDHLQGVPRMEGAAEGPVGRGTQGKREEEVPVYDPGPPCRWEMQPVGTSLPLHHGSGGTGPG